MVEVFSLVGLSIGLFLMAVSLLKLKSQTISQGVFTLWIIVGVSFTLISVVPFAIFTIQDFLGTEFTLSAVFGIAISFLIIVVFFLHQKVDMLNQRVTKLVAELGAKNFSNSQHIDDK